MRPWKNAAVWLEGRIRLFLSMLSATAHVWCVWSTTRAPLMRWIGAWMHCAESSTTPLPSRVRPDSSKTNMSLARASDQCSPKGRIRYWPSRPGTVTVKWLSMPSSSSCSTAMRCAAARCTFASATGSTARPGASDRNDTLLDLRARRVHDLLPLGRLVADHLAEILRSPGDRRAAQLREALAHLRVGERAVHLRVDLLDDFLRGSLGHADAEPCRGLVTRHRLADRRHVGHRRLALRGGHAERAQASALDVGRRRGQVVEHHVHLARDQVGKRGTRALVGHVQHVAAGHRLEELAREVHRGAASRRGHV